MKKSDQPQAGRGGPAPERDGVSQNDRDKVRNKGAQQVDNDPEPGIREDKPNRADFHHGSTTQAGSNYGQGSNDLPDQENRQGSESNDGANYDNEKGWNNEALREEDLEDPQTPAASRVPDDPHRK